MELAQKYNFNELLRDIYLCLCKINFLNKNHISDFEIKIIVNFYNDINKNIRNKNIFKRFTYLVRFDKKTEEFNQFIDFFNVYYKENIFEFTLLKDNIKKEIQALTEINEFYKISKEFLNIAENIYCKKGIYFLFNENKELIYIGKSKDLFKRILGSARERKATYCKYIEVKTFTDLHFLEVFFINKYKPCLNEEFKENDSLTFLINIGDYENYKSNFIMVYENFQRGVI